MEDIVADVQLRPSVLRRFQKKVDALTPHEHVQFVALKRRIQVPKEVTGDALEKRNILDAFLEFVEFEERLGGSKQSEKWLLERNDALLARATLGQNDKVDTVQKLTRTELQQQPHLAHWASRIELSASLDQRQKYKLASSDFKFRPALHDLSSLSQGFSPDLQIEFANLHARYLSKSDDSPAKIELASADLIKILSVPHFTSLLKSPSWTLNIQTEREDNKQNSHLWGGAGITQDLFGHSLKMFAIGVVDTGYKASPFLGVGGYGGILVNLSPQVRIWSDALYLNRFWGLQERRLRWQSQLVVSKPGPLEWMGGVADGKLMAGLRLYF